MVKEMKIMTHVNMTPSLYLEYIENLEKNPYTSRKQRSQLKTEK